MAKRARNFNWLILLSIASILSGCGAFESSNAEKTINAGLEKNALCAKLPVGVPVDKEKISKSSAIGLLMSKGLVADGTVKKSGYFVKTTYMPGYVFTEKGQALVVKPSKETGFGLTEPCVKTGHFKVESIKAIDYGSDAAGKPIANVRVSLKFISEDWLADTKSSGDWSGFWSNIQEKENGEFIFQLLKSGNEFFYTRDGQRIQ